MKIYRSSADSFRDIWWIHDGQGWWYSRHNLTGEVYQWIKYTGVAAPWIKHKDLYESSILTFLVLMGEPIDKTFPGWKQ